jgi:MFS family permease
VAGAAGGALSLLLLAGAGGLLTMAVGWCLVQLTLNAAFAAVTAAVPDRVPRLQRGAVGGWLGAAQIVGVVGGTGLATAAGGIRAGYAACAVFTMVGVLPYVLRHEDLRLAVGDRPPWSWRSFAAGFWLSPRRYPDLGWAWLTRFLINLSNALVLLYLLYYLRDRLHHDDPDEGVLILTAVNGVTLLATVVVGGVWSDRVGRRKPFVIWSSVLMAVATAALAGWQTWPGAIVAAAVLGIGFGVFTSVDFALMTDVLPKARDRGKDLGVINVANALPQVAAPALAAPIVTYLGGYRVLYLAAAGVGLAGAMLVVRIRGVD